MKKINEILNQIGNFYCVILCNTVSFTGFLSRASGKVILQGSINLQQSNAIDQCASLQIWGKIGETPVTFLNAYIKSICSIYGEEYVSIKVDPSEIVIGRSYTGKAEVIQMSASIKSLNYMFSSSPLKISYDYSIDNPTILSYTFPDEITTVDKYGNLRIYQTLSHKWTKNEIRYDIIPMIEYNFSEPLGIMDAVSKIAAVRNLFTIFSNYYLPIEKLSFADESSKCQEHMTFCDCYLYLNNNEDIPVSREPFLIMTSVFSRDFSNIWYRWLQMYEEAIYVPTLFYEIVCNHSTRINYFLNLSQAIEVYSCRYREDNVIKLACEREQTKAQKEPPTYLKYRFEDVLQFISPCLEIEEDIIHDLSNSLASMRNFFSHYNKKRYVEPTYDEMFAACHVLRFVLLAIVYKSLGIADEHIKNCRKRVIWESMNVDYKKLLDYLKRS